MTSKTAPEKIVKSDAEWRKELTPEQYHVTRQGGTERPFTGPYLNEKRAGVYHCVSCGAPLFRSEAKFESGTGWPSFTRPVDEAMVEEITDRSHRHGTHGGALRGLRGPSRPCLPGRPRADGPALLHERLCTGYGTR